MLESIRELLHQSPFIPFRIVLTSGKEYVASNPDLVALGETQMNIYAPRSDHWSILRINQITSVDVVPQAAGRAYAARRVQGLLSPEAAELSLDLAAAYPPEAGIRSWRRTIRLDRASAGDDGAGGGKILLNDTWDLDHSPERTVVYLIAAREPLLVAPGRLLIPADDDNLAIDYPEAGFDAGLEERPVDDPRLAATWGPRVYRIALAARQPGRRGTLHLEIAAAPGLRADPAPDRRGETG